MDEISKTSRTYKKFAKKWQQISLCLEGEEEVKDSGEVLLPYPVALLDIDRKDKEFVEAYKVYQQGAHFVEYTAESVDDLVASAFREEPTIDPEVPSELEYYDWEADAKEIVHKTVSYGNSFILVDYPTVEDPTLAEDVDNLAFTVLYEPLDILDFTVSKRSGKHSLTRIVLREIDEDNTAEGKYIYRELLIVDGVYTIRVHSEIDGVVNVSEYIPTASGNKLTEIPGTFIGVTSNLPKIDKSPIIGISNSNIKHYQTWAELMWTQTYTGHPQMVLSGLQEGWNKEADKQDVKVKLDASNVLALEGENAKAELLEISGSNLVHFQTLEKLEQSMLEQGARIKVQNMKAGVESAEAITIRHSADVSKLGSVVSNVEDGLEKVFGWLSLFMNVSYDPKVEISRAFFTPTIDGALVASLSAAEVARTTPIGTTAKYLQKVELLDKDEPVEDQLERSLENDPLLTEDPE